MTEPGEPMAPPEPWRPEPARDPAERAAERSAWAEVARRLAAIEARLHALETKGERD